jgi:signal transduction histidine kinase
LFSLRITASDSRSILSGKGVHFGLMTMSERAESVGGNSPLPALPEGNRITARLPPAEKEVASADPIR